MQRVIKASFIISRVAEQLYPDTHDVVYDEKAAPLQVYTHSLARESRFPMTLKTFIVIYYM